MELIVDEIDERMNIMLDGVDSGGDTTEEEEEDEATLPSSSSIPPPPAQEPTLHEPHVGQLGGTRENRCRS